MFSFPQRYGDLGDHEGRARIAVPSPAAKGRKAGFAKTSQGGEARALSIVRKGARLGTLANVGFFFRTRGAWESSPKEGGRRG